ncbi:hypothetical protein BDD12DRAFT_278100 [Trichophaea hybrida]|nr:hypothetical protein BDD12DRAFT_278100 [Trichophaea hybrida]
MSLKCERPARHNDTSYGQHQRNPFHALHLGDRQIDIRGLEVGVCFQYDFTRQKTRLVYINLCSSQYKATNNHTLERIRHALEFGDLSAMGRDPFWVHLIFMGTVLSFWKDTLGHFAAELINHEEKIEQQMTAASENPTSAMHNPADMIGQNVALHAMTAHCLRYDTELRGLRTTMAELIIQHDDIAERLKLDSVDKERVGRALKQQLAEAESITQAQAELAKKIENTLALLFHAVQVDQGTEQKELTVQTRNDSFAMKTVALLTMCFLPGTSIAAILALPYFESLKKGAILWIWAVASFTSTFVVFAVYHLFWKKYERTDAEMRDVESGIKPDML